MRIAVMVIGILGSLAAGGFGGLMWAGFQIAEKGIRDTAGVDIANVQGEIRVRSEDVVNLDEARAGIRAYFRARAGIWFVLAAFPLGIFGSILANSGRGFSSAGLLLVAGIGPILLMPGPLLVLCVVAMSLLILAGILALFVRPAPSPRDLDYGN